MEIGARSATILWGLLFAIGAVGCGGGGLDAASGGNLGSSGPILRNTRTTRITFTLGWAERSRHHIPSSALSGAITLTGAGLDGGEFVVPVNRRSDPASYVETYVSQGRCRVGTFPLTMRFFALPDGQGDMVAIGQATVTIRPDGTGIGTIHYDHSVAMAVVDPGQTVRVGQEKQLTFTVRDDNGNLLAVTPGSATWRQLNGASNIAISKDGIATGLQAGSADVMITIDEVLSAPATIVATP